MDIEKPPQVTLVLEEGPGMPAGVTARIGGEFGFNVVIGEEFEMEAQAGRKLFDEVKGIKKVKGEFPPGPKPKEIEDLTPTSDVAPESVGDHQLEPEPEAEEASGKPKKRR